MPTENNNKPERNLSNKASEIRARADAVARDVNSKPHLKALFDQAVQAIGEYQALGLEKDWQKQLKGLGPLWLIVSTPGPGERVQDGMILALGTVTEWHECDTEEALNIALADIRSRVATLKPS